MTVHRVNRNALVPYSAQEMYLLVEDVESYPRFLPWCSDAIVHSRGDATIDASLEVSKAGVHQSFRTLATLVPDESIHLGLISGPFRDFEGGWRFTRLGDEGSKVAFELHFEFANPVVNAMFAGFFEHACNSLVDAFSARAVEVYGAR